ncbi:MAG: hypothetical protein ACH344_10775 [Yersinia sp. (in: enterobacteria)]
MLFISNMIIGKTIIDQNGTGGYDLPYVAPVEEQIASIEYASGKPL